MNLSSHNFIPSSGMTCRKNPLSLNQPVWIAGLCVALVWSAETAGGGLLNLPAIAVQAFVLGKIGSGAQEKACKTKNCIYFGILHNVHRVHLQHIAEYMHTQYIH